MAIRAEEGRVNAITLNAHYDGERILLDEPYELPVNAPLLVTIVSPELSEERDRWARFAAQSLARAYSDNEPEYTIGDCKP
jgi:hypothetical protein